MALYCGKETKVFLNQGKYKFKQSEITKKLNIVLFINVIIILTLAGIFAGRLYHFIKAEGHKMSYVYPEQDI